MLIMYKDTEPGGFGVLALGIFGTTRGGEVFTEYPGEILVATDTTGSGHKWQLVNDEPWKRAYVPFEKGAETHFVPEGE